MAIRDNKDGIPGPDDNTIIEVIRTKGEEVVKKEMTFREWKELKKQPGYTYSAFQRGFSAYNLKNGINENDN